MRSIRKLALATCLLGATTASQANVILNNTTLSNDDYGPNITVSFGGVFPTYDESILGAENSSKSYSLTSWLLEDVTQTDLRNTSLAGIGAGMGEFTGVYVETFDQRTTLGVDLNDSGFGQPLLPQDDQNNIFVQSGNNPCSVNGFSSGVTADGDFGVTSENLGGVAVLDRGVDNTNSQATTCFAFTPRERSQLDPTSTLTIDFSAILASTSASTGSSMFVDYIGFFWGTVDRYNAFSFERNGVEVASIDGTKLYDDLNGLNLGNQGQYVNFSFGNGVGFDKLVVTSSGVATEFDNIVNRISTVPEPSSLILMGLALFGMRRLRK